MLLAQGCRPPLMPLGFVPVPDRRPVSSRPMAVGRRVVLLVEPSIADEAGSDHAYLVVHVRFFPPDTKIGGPVVAHALMGPQTTEMAPRGGLRPVGIAQEYHFEWQGSSARPDAVLIEARQLCVGRECEDLTLRLPVTWPAPGSGR
jgi:hypothetical protein